MKRLVLFLLFPLLSLAQLEVMTKDFSPKKAVVLSTSNDLHPSDEHLIQSTFFKYDIPIRATQGMYYCDRILSVTMDYKGGKLIFIEGTITYDGLIVAIFSFDNQQLLYTRKEMIDSIVKELSNAQ